MEELVKQLAEHVALSIELVAILVVTVGTLEAVAAAIRMIFTGRSDTVRGEAMLKYARWLAAGLTFQLAGDIVHTGDCANVGWLLPAGSDRGDPDVLDLLP